MRAPDGSGAAGMPLSSVLILTQILSPLLVTGGKRKGGPASFLLSSRLLFPHPPFYFLNKLRVFIIHHLADR